MSDLKWRRYALGDATAAAIEAMRPVLEATEVQAEQERRMPEAAVQAIRASGVWKTAVPAVLGGWEASPVLEFEITEAISRISTAAGWTAFIGSFHTSLPAAYLGDAAVAEMFGGDQWPVVAGNFAPLGTSEIVDGGIKVSGRYGFGSGINHADWVGGGCMVSDGAVADAGLLDTSSDGPPSMLIWVAPKEGNVRVLDNWFITGLSGSGSFDYEVEDLFIPDGYWFSWPVPEVKRGGARYAAPAPLQPIAVHSALALGGAERALEVVSELAATKRRLTSKATIADRGAFQRDLGQAYLKLSSARTYVIDLLDRFGSTPWVEQPDQDALAAQLQGAGAYSQEVAVDVAAMAYRYAGASAARLDSPLQRVLRDVLVAQQHILVADTSYDALGQWAIASAAPVAEAVA